MKPTTVILLVWIAACIGYQIGYDQGADRAAAETAQLLLGMKQP